MRRQTSLRMNLKGKELINLGNQGVGRQNSLSMNLKGGKLKKIRKSRCGEAK